MLRPIYGCEVQKKQVSKIKLNFLIHPIVRIEEDERESLIHNIAWPL